MGTESQPAKGEGRQNRDIPPGNQKVHKASGRDHPWMPKAADEGGGAGGYLGECLATSLSPLLPRETQESCLTGTT